jgi:hypothetical protein
MAFTTPGTAVAGSVLTSAFWNTNVRDNTAALFDLASAAVKFTIKTDTQSTSLTAGNTTPILAQGNLTNFGINHAVQSSNHRVVLFAQVHHVVASSLNQGGAFWNVDNVVENTFRGDAAGSRIRLTSHGGGGEARIPANLFMQAIYSPGDTASHFYGISVANITSVTQTNHVNRSSTDSNDNVNGRPTTSMILMEVGPA